MKFNYVLFFKVFALLFLVNMIMSLLGITEMPMYVISFICGWYVVRFISYIEGKGPQHLFTAQDDK